MTFGFIEAEKASFPINRMCRVLGVSQSGFFAWQDRPACRRQRQDMVYLAHIRTAFALSNGTYGSPRMHRDLVDEGHEIGRHRTARLMRENRLCAEFDVTVTAQYFFHAMQGNGDRGGGSSDANYHAEWMVAYDAAVTANAAAGLPAPRPLIIAAGGQVSSVNSDYYMTQTLYWLARDLGGIIPTWHRIYTTRDDIGHIPPPQMVLEGETCAWALEVEEGGQPWTIWYDVTKSGLSAVVTFDLLPGETLMDRPDLFDGFGGLATCPDYGFQSDAAFVSVVPDFEGNSVAITFASPPTWLSLAMQRQDMRPYSVPVAEHQSGGAWMSAHRTTLFGSVTRASVVQPGETLYRPVPSIFVRFDGDTVLRMNGQPFDAAPTFARTATTAEDHIAVDGHSLDDNLVHTGPYPQDFRSLRNSQMSPPAYDNTDGIVFESTIAGPPLGYRLGHMDAPGPSLFCADPSPISEVTTSENGPPFIVGNPATDAQRNATLDYWIEYLELCHANDCALNLWSIWPQVDGWVGHSTLGATWGQLGGFRECLPEYGHAYEYMADYGAWKMRQLHPYFPDDHRIWIFPRHLWWQRVYDDQQDDLVPGVTTLESLMHPNDPNGGDDTPIHAGALASYGLACLAFTCQYQIDVTTASGVYIPGAWTELHPQGNVDWPAITPEQAEYFWRIAWEIATSYEPAGMGGTQGAALEFDGTVDADPLDDTPVDPGGDLPEFDLIEWTAGGYTGPSLTGPQPTVAGGELQFRGSTPLTGTLAAGAAAYGIAALGPVSAAAIKGPPVILHSNATWWQGPFFSLTWNGYLGAAKYLAETEGNVTAEPPVQSGATPSVVEWWTDGDAISISVDGGPTVTTTLAATKGATGYITLFGQIDGAPEYNVTALGMASAVPDEAGRAAARARAGGAE